jgi:hypothetical protein
MTLIGLHVCMFCLIKFIFIFLKIRVYIGALDSLVPKTSSDFALPHHSTEIFIINVDDNIVIHMEL